MLKKNVCMYLLYVEKYIYINMYTYIYMCTFDSF